MDKPKKIYLFVDGSNLYAGQYELFGPKKFLDFGKLIDQVEEKLKIKFSKIYFYASYSPKPKKLSNKIKEYLINESIFFTQVKRTPKLVFFKGYRSATSGKEKEVDVKLTADLVSMTLLGECESVYLFTGDADFLQALMTVKPRIGPDNIFVISLENRFLFRASFFFNTYNLIFSNNPPVIVKKRFQRITNLKMEEDSLVDKIKSPRVQAPEAS